MNNRRTKNIFRILLAQLIVGSIMLLIGFSIAFYAQGYRFNFYNFKVIKTGIIFVAGYQKSADIYFNNRLVSQKMPYAQNLLPGSYHIEIKKDGYQPWNMTTNVTAELVSDYRTIILFKDKIEPVLLTDEKKIALLNAPIDILAVNADKALTYNEHEIWINDTLVTRFSNPIQQAVWYPDLEHIIYQQGRQVRAIEKNGYNDTFLFELSSDSSERFVIGGKGEELYFTDSGINKVATLR